MNNFKAGDLALIVGAVKCTENIGKVVTLGSILSAGDLTPNGRTARSNGYVVYGDGLLISNWASGEYLFKEKSAFTICRPCDLMPIKGDFATVKEKQEEQPA